MNFRSILLNNIWVLQRPNGEVRTSKLVFNQDGSLSGYMHENEHHWVIDGTKLSFYDVNGARTSCGEFSTVTTSDIFEITFMREDNHTVPAHRMIKQSAVNGILCARDTASIAEEIVRHKAFDGKCFLNMKGFSPPAFRDPRIIEVRPESLDELKQIGIHVQGKFGPQNAIVFERDHKIGNARITFEGHAVNTLIFGSGCRFSGDIRMAGHENIFVLGKGCSRGEVRASVEMRHGSTGLLLGAGGSSGNTTFWLEGPRRSIQVGDDYMFSWDVWVRTADSHAIIDLDSGEVRNEPKSVLIEKHVWLGQDAIVMPGCHIGAGSIVGARSLVTKSVPPQSVVAGIPASVVRERTTWNRDPHPSPQDIASLQQEFPPKPLRD